MSNSKSPRHYKRILSQYSSLMEEIKRRQAVIASVINMQVAIPADVGCELCYLQLRFICELIALGCLTAHEDIEATTTGRMRRSYAADWIIGRLEQIHPDFFPHAGRQVRDANGRPTNVEPVTSGFLTKVDLLNLYHECGVWLHRGSLKSVLAENPKEPKFDVVNEWSHKIVALLNHHQIQLSNPDLMIWTLMESKEDGAVHSHLMSKILPAIAAAS